ncbi:MAG: SpoIIIAH-like family protein [Clostridia bacterium]|nr:SpoIIIAH-like family protein [Clostridia bacterium]
MKDRILNILMLIAVAAALILTFLKGAPETDTALPMTAVSSPAATASPHPAEVYRARRRETRALEQSLLTTLMESSQTAQETRSLAEQQLIEITRNDEIELAVEGALTAHGYADALCVARDGSMTLFLPTEIQADEAAFFLEIARDASGLEPENIRLTGY